MDKLKDLQLKIEPMKQRQKRLHKNPSLQKEDNSPDTYIKYVLSIMENIDFLMKIRYFENDEYQHKMSILENIYQSIHNQKQISGDIYKMLLSSMKGVSMKSVKEIFHFYFSSPSSTMKEYVDLYDQFFHPIHCELLHDPKEIENLQKTFRISETKYFPYYKINFFKYKILDEKIEGLTIIFPNSTASSLLVVNGFFKRDSLGFVKNHVLLKSKHKQIEEEIEYLDVPQYFKKIYLTQLSTRDFIYLTPREIAQLLKTDYEEFHVLRNKNLSLLVKEFMKSPIERQRKILTLFLLYDTSTQFSAHVIYDLLTNQTIYMNGIPIYDLLYQSLHWKVQSIFKETKSIEEETKKKLSNLEVAQIPYDVRIANMNASDFVKSKAFEKFKEINGSKDNSVKAQQWLDGLLKIPFGVYKEEKIIKFFHEFQSRLENYVKIASLKLVSFEESQLDSKNKRLYGLYLSLIDHYKNHIIYQSDNEYDIFIELCKEILMKSIIYVPLLSMNMKYEYNKEQYIKIKADLSQDEYARKMIEMAIKNHEHEHEHEHEHTMRVNIEHDHKQIRLGRDRSDSVDFTSDEILRELNIDHLSERNKEVILSMIQKQKIPNGEILEKCISELSHIRRIKSELIKENRLNEESLNVLIEKLNILESAVIHEDDYDLDIDEDVDREAYVDEHIAESPSLSNNINKEFRRFILRNFIEVDRIVMEWIEFKKSKKEYMKYIDKTLDKCVHGHLESKQQIKRLVGQMMNSSSKKKKGFCLGLQGPPGVGKTTICLNGLAKCLMDENGDTRPIIFIPLGGSANGSTLEGHNYTYLGSTWGKIADALMEAKCMNPIIFIDELDKISKTEHGREIASLLTHITDQTQNSEFFDKYFASVPLDLSRVIFIFSYNDRNNVDKILLDRIQEVKIKPLGKQDKVIISKNYVLPEIYKSTGFSKDEIHFPSKLLSNIIENYTYEAGVRKLSEILNDIIREINLRRIMGTEYTYPIQITEDLVEEILDDKPKMSYDKVIDMPLVGVSYGMYASSVGYGGGISKIQTVFIPSSHKKVSIQKSTGLAGDMMKESFEVCMSVAYNLIPDDVKKSLSEREDNGIHIHFNDSSVNKDGPSGGQAITLSLVSLLTNTKVRNHVAITGEINLLGFAMKIGGVFSKINGSIRAGINTFIIPKENREDIVQMIRSEYKNHKNLKETYLLNQPISLTKSSSFLNLDSINSNSPIIQQNDMDYEIQFESCEEYPGVELIYYKHCKVYLVDNIYQVLQIALVDHNISFKPLF